MRREIAARGLCAALLFAAAAASAPSCASEESVLFGDPDGGGIGVTATTGSGAPCTVDPACKVSFKKDIFPPIIDGAAGCTKDTACHGSEAAPGNMILKAGDAAGAYTQLTSYQLKKAPGPPGAYIVPCDKVDSRLLCNLALDSGMNPYGNCGTAMPFGTATKITKQQLDTLAEWIACGAPNN